MIPDSWVFDGGQVKGGPWKSEDFFSEVRKIMGLKESSVLFFKDEYEERVEKLYKDFEKLMEDLKDLAKRAKAWSWDDEHTFNDLKMKFEIFKDRLLLQWRLFKDD